MDPLKSRLPRVLALLELPQMLLYQTMHTQALQLRAEDKDLVGAQRVIPVNDLEDLFQHLVELRIEARDRFR